LMRWKDLSMPTWPEWWYWELELSPHLLKRMMDRGFNEVDLRAMLSDATDYRPDIEPGRFVVDARHEGRDWEVIVEPDSAAQMLVVVTAYPLS